ncbi:swr1 complex component, partial [Marasmius crinis-equi]
MTTYDPEEAKKDDSKAFREYKSNFDLLETATTTPNSTGPQRRTRSTQNERTSSLFGQPSLSISSHTPPAKRRKIAPTTEILDIISSAKTQLQRKGREKEKDTLEDSVMGESPSISVGKVKRKGVLSESTQEVERRSPSKGKGKEKPTATTAEHGTVESISVGMKSNASRAKKKSGMAEDADRHAPSKGKEKANETAPESISRGKRKSVTLEPPKPQEDEMPTYSTTRKRRKSEAGPLIQNNTHDPGGPISSPIIHLPRTKLKSISRPNPIPPALPSTRDPAPQPPPPRSPIKRIRLIVRKPPPLISHPLQRPPAPKFDGNLQKLILTFPFDKDLDDDARVTEEAKLRERAAQLRKEGRYFGDLDLNFSQLDESETQVNPQRSGYQGRPERKDTWDHLLEDVSTQHQARKKRVQGEAIAGFIASKIRAYWDAQAVKQDKARAVEEKRLRGLAKATVRMVVGEWRKVIFHIREQERLRAEAEELKRGHEHLDAILNQSGQILETQQGDLARSRSRSGSAPASLLYPHDSDEEEEGEESEGENSDEESGDEEDGEGVQVEEDEAPVNVDVDLAALYELDDAPPGPTRHFRSPSSSPSMASQRSVRPDTPMDEDTTLLATSSIPGRTPSRDPIDPD